MSRACDDHVHDVASTVAVEVAVDISPVRASERRDDRVRLERSVAPALADDEIGRRPDEHVEVAVTIHVAKLRPPLDRVSAGQRRNRPVTTSAPVVSQRALSPPCRLCRRSRRSRRSLRARPRPRCRLRFPLRPPSTPPPHPPARCRRRHRIRNPNRCMSEPRSARLCKHKRPSRQACRPPGSESHNQRPGRSPKQGKPPPDSPSSPRTCERRTPPSGVTLPRQRSRLACTPNVSSPRWNSQ